MDERLDRISASAFKTIFCCSVCRSLEVWTGITISNEASSLPHCDVDSPDSFKQLRLSVAAGAHGKGIESRRVVSPHNHDALGEGKLLVCQL